MPRIRNSNGFTALRVEGSILPPEYLQAVAGLEATHQAGADYGLSESLVLKEEIARFWRIANDHYARYSMRRVRRDLNSREVGVDKWLVPLLETTLGYKDLTASNNVALGDRVFKLTHLACGGAVPHLLTTSTFDLDKADPHFGYEGRRQSPHGLLQEYLNAEEKCLWGLVSNGSKLRILRDNSSLTRPSYLEVDLDLVFTEDLYPDFVGFWLAVHASRFKPVNDKASGCIFEGWRAKAHETGERILADLRDGVTEALQQIGSGFLQHPENGRLRAAFGGGGGVTSESYFQQLLRMVYRLLFLFTAEERNLLHAPDATGEQRVIFAEGYGLSRLRDRALRRRYYNRHGDLWQSLQITFGALAKGASALGLPALGGLFDPVQCPDLDAAAITNEYLLDGIRSLAFFRSGTALARVNYRDMGTEELGSVYESLLELQPVVDTTFWTFSFVDAPDGQKSRGSKRKLTGSYYTPASLVNELIKSALDPVLDEALREHPENPHQAILDLNVIDPACGSGHFLLAAARRMAAEIMRIEAGTGSYDEATRQHALREVVQHCIYGVDRNPLAVELCKTALWMETVEPGKPLTFLDAHIHLGDSLVGIMGQEIMAQGIPGEAYKPLAGDNKTICQSLKKRNRQVGTSVPLDLFDDKGVVEEEAGADINAMPEETDADIERKSEAWQKRQRNEIYMQKKLRGDLFVGAYFAPKTKESAGCVPNTGDINRLATGIPQRPGVKGTVQNLAGQHRFFHWHLVFKEIMQSGGFDVVLGNPPWEQIELQEKEFFATRSREIATAPNTAARVRLIRKLANEDAQPAERAHFVAYEAAKRKSEAISQFVRSGGRFPLTGAGRLNTYALFAELFLHLTAPGGRAGLIVPSGIASDKSTSAFFEDIVGSRRLANLYDFENREKIFPGIDSRIKFCLLTLSGTDRPCAKAEFVFFLHQAEQIGEKERRFTLSAEDFALFNPNTRTCPIFRTRRDMEIVRKMYLRAGILWKEKRGGEPEENPWGIRFMTMFNMSTDSGLFRTRGELTDAGWELQGNVFERGGECYLPLYEGKLFHQYDHRFATFEGMSENALKSGNARAMTPEEKANPDAVVLPRYWVSAKEVAKKLERLGTPLPLGSVVRPEARGPRPEARGPRGHGSWVAWINWRELRSQENNQFYQRANRDFRSNSPCRPQRFRHFDQGWLLVFRDITGSTNERTSIFSLIWRTAVNNKAPSLNINPGHWLQVLRGITNSTNERTLLTTNIPLAGVGNSAPVIDHAQSRTIASALVLANMNSLPLDWATRLSVGGVNLNFFIVKQLPVLSPEVYLEQPPRGGTWVQYIIPRVLELTYTAHDMASFARDLGYVNEAGEVCPPFPWDSDRRHHLQSELDAIYAHMYGLQRTDLEWILNAPEPSTSFPGLKHKEVNHFGEYRTQRYVLQAYDQMARGELPNLAISYTKAII